jgi:tol-pal system protein YbgF
MNARIALLLCACSTACAEMPPVVDTTTNPALNAAKPPVAALTSDYEMMKRIEQMQAEVQQLTGKVEEQASQIEELKKQQKTMFTDFDDRIQSLENKSGARQPSAETPVEPSTSIGSGADVAVPPAPVTTDGSTSGAPVNPAETAAPAAAAPALAASAPSTDTGASQVPENEKQEYQQGYDDLRNGRTAQAITEFNAFITSHPGSSYASNAQYWLGEAHRVDQDNTSARKAFNDVVEKHPGSAKVPDALLKLGYIEMEEKNPVKAREYLMRVTTEFANSRAAGLAQKKLLLLDANPK